VDIGVCSEERIAGSTIFIGLFIYLLQMAPFPCWSLRKIRKYGYHFSPPLAFFFFFFPYSWFHPAIPLTEVFKRFCFSFFAHKQDGLFSGCSLFGNPSFRECFSHVPPTAFSARLPRNLVAFVFFVRGRFWCCWPFMNLCRRQFDCPGHNLFWRRCRPPPSTLFHLNVKLPSLFSLRERFGLGFHSPPNALVFCTSPSLGPFFLSLRIRKLYSRFFYRIGLPAGLAPRPLDKVLFPFSAGPA